MKPVVERLNQLEFFRSLEPATRRAMIDRGQWYSLAGGWELFKQGAPSDTIYFVLSGRLIVVRQCPDGEEVIGYIRAGEPVGEMALLSDERHSASVYALRDTEILALSQADFDALFEEHSDLAGLLVRAVLGRTRHPKSNFSQSSPRVFALIGSSPSIDIDALANRMAKKIERYGLSVHFMPDAETAPPTQTAENIEATHDIVILAARIADSPWYRFVLRQADRFFVFARRDARPSKPFPLMPAEDSPARKFRLVDLVILHEGEPACEVLEWVDAIDANRIFHLRNDACVNRLARAIGGVSVGLVLSGGGARAYAQIGAVKALREAGVPIDFVCGSSMGGIVAACVAMEWSDEEIERRICEAFVFSNPLSDHVLPVVALTRGKRVEDRLLTHFGDARIEDLMLPFFCVSSELTEGVVRVHRRGLLRKALRASIALPGILPPVVDGAALLVDGAVINNFPTDLMSGMHRGLTIGIDVARRGSIRAADFEDPPGFLRWIGKHGFRSAPPIVSLLMRSATARHENTLMAHPADIMIAPDVAGVELRDWRLYGSAVTSGYEVTKDAIKAHWATLGPIAEAARGD